MGTIRRWLNRHATNQLCAQAIRARHLLDQHHQRTTSDLGPYHDIDTYGTTLYGKLLGIRTAICALNGWDVDFDSRDNGPADQLIQAYREARDPNNAPDPW